MIRQLNVITLFIILFSFSQVHGEYICTTCYINTVKSQNGEFYLKTIPFDQIAKTTTGKTIVYKSDSTELYEIPRHFELYHNSEVMYLSNDGQYIAYINNREYYNGKTKNNSVEIFKNGILINTFSLLELVDCDSENEDCFLFYKNAIDSFAWKNGRRYIVYKNDATDFQKTLTENASYQLNDTIFIFTKIEKLIKISLKTGDLTQGSFSSISQNKFEQLEIMKIESIKLEPSSNKLPNLTNGKSFEKSLAKYLDMAIFPYESKRSNKFKRYPLKLEIIIDSSGNAQLDKPKNNKNIPIEKIESFLAANIFETSAMPNGIEKWRYSGLVFLMNKSRRKSKKERIQELNEEYDAYENRIIADTINGIYIPKNLEDCFTELDKLLKPKDIETIKNLKDRTETIAYHHGFGTWIRNNWGLWGGSRLQQYLNTKGINHPDSMSVLILEYYYDWLNGQNKEWEIFEVK